MSMTQSTDKILSLLLQKHSKDLCVPECKTGSTWYNPMFQKLDLWVMKKSWTKPWTVGYEIKRSRSDFLRDTKWGEYVKYCTDFYFVSPPDVIQPEELPADVGLIVTSKNITRLYTKRKAIHRQIEMPESLYRYILMWRVSIIKEQEDRSKENYWKIWLAKKDEHKELGYNVGTKISELVEQRIDKVEVENNRLERENERLAEMKKVMEDLGCDKSYYSIYKAKDKLGARIKELETGIPDGLLNYLDNAIKNLGLVREKLELK